MRNIITNEKGQMTSLGAVLIALVTVTGGIATSKITANSTINEKITSVREYASGGIAEAKQMSAVNATQISINEKNNTDRLNRLEDKIDWLVRQQGGIPTQIISNSTR